MPSISQRDCRFENVRLSRDVTTTPAIASGSWATFTLILPDKFASKTIIAHIAAEQLGPFVPVATLAAGPSQAILCPPEISGAPWLKLTTADDADCEITVVMKS